MKDNVNADLLQDLATGPSLPLDIKQNRTPENSTVINFCIAFISLKYDSGGVKEHITLPEIPNPGEVPMHRCWFGRRR